MANIDDQVPLDSVSCTRSTGCLVAGAPKIGVVPLGPKSVTVGPSVNKPSLFWVSKYAGVCRLRSRKIDRGWNGCFDENHLVVISDGCRQSDVDRSQRSEVRVELTEAERVSNAGRSRAPIRRDHDAGRRGRLGLKRSDYLPAGRGSTGKQQECQAKKLIPDDSPTH